MSAKRSRRDSGAAPHAQPTLGDDLAGTEAPQHSPDARLTSARRPDAQADHGAAHIPGNEPGNEPGRQPATEARDEPSSDRTLRITSSMLWAAWADALGFISELTDATGLRRRLSGKALENPVAWRRRIGGRFGVQAELPAGCYSDDTQLRLATGRAISGHGFDVEAFARVELTVWPTYALGGGRSSRAAATAMAKSRASWFANFYDGWHEGGGNGVAMRAQPHVWATPDLDGDLWLGDTLANGAVTHGHPRALTGAALSNAALAFTLGHHRRPTVEDWPTLLKTVAHGPEVLARRSELDSIWRPSWEKAAGKRFDSAWQEALDELHALTDTLGPLTAEFADHAHGDTHTIDTAWARILNTLELFADATRGSGTATVAAALALTAAFDEPAAAARCAARAVGSDTDTIATVAAAILGAATPGLDPPTPVQDESYLRAEAARLSAVGEGRAATMHSYPDLLRWAPPQSQLDGVGSIGSVGDDLALAGLGALIPLAEPIEAKDACWQWTRIDFGASMLVKRRPAPRPLPAGNVPPRRDQFTPGRAAAARPTPADQSSPARPAPPPGARTGAPTSLRPREADAPRPLADGTGGHRDNDAVTAAATGHRPPASTTANVDQMLEWIERQGYADHAIGYATKRLSEIGSVEQLVAFTVALRGRLTERHAAH